MVEQSVHSYELTHYPYIEEKRHNEFRLTQYVSAERITRLNSKSRPEINEKEST